MKINLAKSAGFCFGVKRAIEIAFKTAGRGKTVYMLGDIVHNEEVVKQIKKAGISKIKKLRPSGKGKILLIRAHGAGLNTFLQAKRMGYGIVDASCPMVKEIHKIAREMENKGYRMIIIGDKLHDEVQGISGQLKNPALIISPGEKISQRMFEKYPKACVVAQSTQNKDKVLKIVKKIRKYFQELKFFNTICLPTQTKQAEIKAMPKENDVMIIIGSKASANTKRLYQIAKSLNPHSYWISSYKEIKPLWLKSVKSVGITAGASTPNSTTQAVINYLKKIS